jgi:U6 snRNA-associated Sm-like protein LSm4
VRYRANIYFQQLPLGLLTSAQGSPILVELKDGETLNGHLVTCDTWMNLILTNVVQTNADGERFFKLQQVYVRGNNVRWMPMFVHRGALVLTFQQIKYLRVPDEVIEKVKDTQLKDQAQRGGRGGGQAGRGDRGRGGARGARGGRGRGRGAA